MTSIFIFISGATLLVYSAEKLIGFLVDASRGLKISVFLLAIIFTGIEFDDIVLGVALNLEGLQGVALGLVLGTAVSFTGVVLALGAIIAPTEAHIPRDYIAIFALAPLAMVAFALTEPITKADGAILLAIFAAFLVYIAVKEHRRETATFRNLEVLEELDGEDDGDGPEDPVRAQAVSTMMPHEGRHRLSGWINLALALVALVGIIIGAATMSTGTEGILAEYGIEGTVFGATIVTAVLAVEDLFLTVQPIRRGVPEIGIGNVIGSLVFSVTGKLGIVVLAGGSIAVGSNVLRWHLPALMLFTAAAAYFLSTGQLKRWHGYVLLGFYVAYWILSFIVYGGAPVED
jgi:cation:H+ antiporter